MESKKVAVFSSRGINIADDYRRDVFVKVCNGTPLKDEEYVADYLDTIDSYIEYICSSVFCVIVPQKQAALKAMLKQDRSLLPASQLKTIIDERYITLLRNEGKIVDHTSDFTTLCLG